MTLVKITWLLEAENEFQSDSKACVFSEKLCSLSKNELILFSLTTR